MSSSGERSVVVWSKILLRISSNSEDYIKNVTKIVKLLVRKL